MNEEQQGLHTQRALRGAKLEGACYCTHTPKRLYGVASDIRSCVSYCQSSCFNHRSLVRRLQPNRKIPQLIAVLCSIRENFKSGTKHREKVTYLPSDCDIRISLEVSQRFLPFRNCFGNLRSTRHRARHGSQRSASTRPKADDQGRRPSLLDKRARRQA